VHQSNIGNRINVQWIFKSLLVPFVCVALLAAAIGIAAAANTAGPGDGTYGGYTTHYWGAYVLDTTDGTLYGYCVDPVRPAPTTPRSPTTPTAFHCLQRLGSDTRLARDSDWQWRTRLSADDLAGAISMVAYNTYGGGSIDDGPVSAASISTVTNFIDNYPGTWTIGAHTLQAAPRGYVAARPTPARCTLRPQRQRVPVQILSPPSARRESSVRRLDECHYGGGGNASFTWTDNNVGDSFSASFTSRYGLPTGLADIGLAPAGSGGQTMLLGTTRNTLPQRSMARLLQVRLESGCHGVPDQGGQLATPRTPRSPARFSTSLAPAAPSLHRRDHSDNSGLRSTHCRASRDDGRHRYEMIETTAPPGYTVPTDNVTSFTTPPMWDHDGHSGRPGLRGTPAPF